ncbi:hypothetical protein BT96DRAFT_986367 [Gymnopus androsaceus JB14]|uniref:Uncharacterized protein n=1 Tax=Gymnopus androsaceus JB14 TaxID=1447944 RepID=A0A6A4IDB4_9AGAR|nr:hypothetical protein BT96DRAFT_986367 [Gymnopus androsaceus JB14]
MAYDLKELPEIMWPYNEVKKGSLYGRIMKNLTFLDYQVGTLIVKLNSMTGITILSFVEMISAAHKCSGCCCVFLSEGYHAHVGYDDASGFTSHCCNSPSLPIVPTYASSMPKYTGVDIDRQNLNFDSGLCTEVGRAYLAWNSRLGIPEDLVRTFVGHRRHFDQNLCNEAPVGDVHGWIGKLTTKQVQEHQYSLLPAVLQPKASYDSDADSDSDSELGELLYPSDN